MCKEKLFHGCKVKIFFAIVKIKYAKVRIVFVNTEQIVTFAQQKGAYKVAQKRNRLS